MRKLSLFGIIFVLSATRLCFAAAPFHIELYGETQNKEKYLTLGTKISSPFTEFHFSAREEKRNFGILLTTKNLSKQIPVELKYGNLSFAGSLSRLNSPELSKGISPFTSSILSTNCVSALLPGYSSFTKPESTFFQIKLQNLNKSPFSLTVNMSASPDNSYPFFSSLISNRFFSNQLILNASCTAGKFFYEENTGTAWFLNSPYYNHSEHICSLFQFSAIYKGRNSNKSIQSVFTTALYESPFGPYSAAYRTDIKISMKNIDFFTEAFLNPYEDLLTSSGKELEPCTEFKTGFTTKQPFLFKTSNLLFIKTGLNAFTRLNFTKNEHDLRINAGIQFSSDITALSFSASMDTKMLSPAPDEVPKDFEKESLLFQIKNSWYLKAFTASVLAGLESDNYKFSVVFSNKGLNNKPKLNSNCTLNLKAKDGQICSKKLSLSLNCRFYYKMLTIIGKLSATLE